MVDGVGLDRAAQIFYDGFTSLPEFANFCDARNATVAVAGARRTTHQGRVGGGRRARRAARRACRRLRPASVTTRATIPFESPHPYGNNGDCTWTYDNGTAGFAFHFSLLDTEEDFDYVLVSRTATATCSSRYTGLFRRGGDVARASRRPRARCS